MDKFKKIASLEELEALKNLIHYENSGEHKPQDKREKILVDFTKPVGKIKTISETAPDSKKVTVLPADSTNGKDLTEKFRSIIQGGIEKGAVYFEICALNGTESIPCRKFFEIYAESVLNLKKDFPDIKLGAGGFDNCVSDYVHEFMNYLSNDKRVPLDFFSWQKSASKAEQLQNYTYAARTLLDKYGFGETENIITSWCYSGSQTGSAPQKLQSKEAAFAVASLISLQKTPADVAIYGKENYGENKKCRLAFEAFEKISSLGIEVTSDTAADHVYVIGAKNDDKGAFLLASFNPYEDTEHELVFDLKGIFGKKCEIYAIDREHDLELVYEGNIPESYKVMPNTILFIKLI